MANNPYVNKVIYGNQTLIDTTGDTAVASDVASGKTFHSATGEQLTGTKTAPTSITPSNASPVALSSSGEYAPTESGYAIKQYTNVDPNPSGGGTGTYHITNTNDARIFKSEGWIVPDRTEVTPSNSSPVSLQSSKNYYIASSSNGGYAIESYNTINPSNSTPPSLASGSIYKTTDVGHAIKGYSVFQEGTLILPAPAGTFVKFEGSGVAIPSITEIAPSNLTPAPMTSGGFYEAMNSGYAIQSYSSVTPTDDGVYVATGMKQITNYAGYLYKTRPSSAKTGTKTATGVNTAFSISTGLSSIRGFMAHSTSTSSTFGDGMQQAIRYQSSDGNYFYAVGHQSAGVASKTAFGTTLGCCFSIQSITGGTISLKTATANANWAGVNIFWVAW